MSALFIVKRNRENDFTFKCEIILEPFKFSNDNDGFFKFSS